MIYLRSCDILLINTYLVALKKIFWYSIVVVIKVLVEYFKREGNYTGIGHLLVLISIFFQNLLSKKYKWIESGEMKLSLEQNVLTIVTSYVPF